MNLQFILTLIRRWLWLFLVGLLIGTGIGYYYSMRQAPIYASSTKLMVISATGNSSTNRYASTLGDQQLARTYSQLFTTDAVLDNASERLGYHVSAGQIIVQEPDSSQIIQLTVQDSSSQRAADIANTLAIAFEEYALELESGRFLASEETLTLQLDQAQERISELEDEMVQITSSSQQNQLQSLQEEIMALEDEISALVIEIETLEENDNSGTISAENERLIYEKQLDLNILQAAFDYQLDISLNGFSASQREAAALELASIQDEIVAIQSEILTLSTPIVSETANLLESKRSELALLNNTIETYQRAYLDALLNVNGTYSPDAQLRISQIQSGLSLYQQIYANLLPSYEAVRLTRLQNTTRISQVKVATPAQTPLTSSPFIILGSMIGLTIAACIAFAFEYLDNTVKSPTDVSQKLKLTPIGLFLHDKLFSETEDLYVNAFPRAPLSEAYRILRANLEFASVDKALNTLLITSPQPADGKSTVVANLAAIMAQGEKRIILIDADLRRPTLHKTFKLNNSVGLSNLFLGTPLSNAIRSTSIRNLRVITSGPLPPNPVELLSSERMSSLLEMLQEQADIVIIDTPPLIVSDPNVLAAKVDGTLMVLRANKTSISVAKTALEQLSRSNTHIIGAVLNRLPRQTANQAGYSYYGYYYGPGDENDMGQPTPKQKRRRKKTLTQRLLSFSRQQPENP